MNTWMRALGGLVVIGVVAATASAANATANVIPQPAMLEMDQGRFVFGPQTCVIAEGQARAKATQLIGYLSTPMGYRLELVADSKQRDNCVRLEIEVSLGNRLGDEGYQLEVGRASIDIRAAGLAGLFYGVQTLRQLLPEEVYSAQKVKGVQWTVPCMRIVDYPRFPWRGLLIDPARHFIPVQDVKEFIDIMAIHKFNRLQIHLTDNEGWRIEVRKYPKLSQLGSGRDWSCLREGSGEAQCPGFYTQNEIREIVRYAADRHITIVPEIEMPYHTGAAIVAYPELGVNTEYLTELSPDQRWGKTKGLIAPRPETVSFLQDVLAEVIELFPGEHIHIGGDEANITQWANDPEMQAQIRRLKLKDAHELHSWFIRQMDTFLTER